LEARGALRMLLSHPRYRDDYISPESETDHPVHGPYRLDIITVDAFEELDATGAVAILREWVEGYGPVLPEQIEGNLDQVLMLVSEAQTRFHSARKHSTTTDLCSAPSRSLFLSSRRGGSPNCGVR
jgi:hypothetical protein